MEIARFERLLFDFFKSWPELRGKMNVIILLDQGMAETRPELVIDIERNTAKSTLQDVVSSAFGMFVNIGVSAESVYRAI